MKALETSGVGYWDSIRGIATVAAEYFTVGNDLHWPSHRKPLDYLTGS